MNLEATLAELRARLTFAKDSPSLLLAICPTDAAIEETRTLLRELLQATPLTLADLGLAAGDAGPAAWTKSTRETAGDAYLLAFTATARLTIVAFARLANAERQLLRDLPGPLVLLLSKRSEQILRKEAQDFFTWVAASYELPEPHELRELATRLGVASPAATTPHEDPIRFLHLSDLHLVPPAAKRYDQSRVLDGLLALLERDRPAFPLDLVFLTGDLAQSGKPEEYALIVELLTKLMATTGVRPEHVFVVPGNHDVDRGVGRWLLRTLPGDDDAIAFFVDPKNRSFHAQKMAAYADSMRSLLGTSRRHGLGVGAEAVELIALKGARLAVASFNSAWFAQGDDDKEKLWLGEPNIRGALEHIADAEADFAVALMHHPFEDLHPDDRERVEPLFDRGFDLVLRGHLHAARTHARLSQRGGYVEQAAPSAYQGSKWPNGCFLGELRPRARTVRLRPYAFASGADPWVLNPKIFPDDEPDGYCHTFTVPTKRREQTASRRLMRGAAAEAIKSASASERQDLRAAADDSSAVPESSDSSDSAAADAIAENPGVLRTFIGAHNQSHVMFEVAEAIAHAQIPGPRITITDRESLGECLLSAGRLYLRHATTSRVSEAGALMAFSAALERVVEGIITNESSIRAGARVLHPDIVIRDRSGALRVVFEITSSQTHKVRANILRLKHYMQTIQIKLGALVVLPPFSASEPKLEPQLDTLEDSEVLLLWL